MVSKNITEYWSVMDL